MKRLGLISLLLLCALPVLAAPQSHERIRETALAFAQAQAAALPGKVTIHIGEIDKRTSLRACTALEAYQPAGASMLGRTTIGVRCNEKPGWSVFIQAEIRVSTTLLIASRPLTQNSVLTEGDFTLQNGELGQPGLLTDPAQAIGKTLKFGIGAGQVLRQDMLRSPFVVLQNQTVDVLVRGDGYTVRASGQVLANASEGQSVQVRMASGQVIRGNAAADGTVEVRP